MIDSGSLFGTVPARDYLQFWQSGRFQPQRVTRFLDLSKDEIAKLAGVSPSSVRFDHKLPRDVRDRLTEIAATCTRVAEFFEGDAIKTSLWFSTPNALLDERSPRDIVRAGQHDRLRRIILRALHSPPRDAAAETAARRPAGLLTAVTREEIAQLCRGYGVRRLALFGSTLRDDFDPARSDVDVAVEFVSREGESPARQYFDFKTALERLFGRSVDLVELSAMPDSRLKRHIERTQRALYDEAA
jgi:predicted nucleotidyltransferase